MILLVSTTPAELRRWRHPNLGMLCSPKYVYRELDEWPWAADNDAFSRWDARLYQRMLDIYSGQSGCLFVNAPDVVGDADETLRRFEQWHDALTQTGLPISFVAQDGLRLGDVPWDDIAAVFIGGTTAFKYSPTVHELAAEAKARGKWLHLGRVNSERRLKYAKALGCDSVDGTSLARFRNERLGRLLRAAAAPKQLMLETV